MRHAWRHCTKSTGAASLHLCKTAPKVDLLVPRHLSTLTSPKNVVRDFITRDDDAKTPMSALHHFRRDFEPLCKSTGAAANWRPMICTVTSHSRHAQWSNATRIRMKHEFWTHQTGPLDNAKQTCLDQAHFPQVETCREKHL